MVDSRPGRAHGPRLMVVQFSGSPDAFVNRTAGGEGEMMMSALGKVRRPGLFHLSRCCFLFRSRDAFLSGPVCGGRLQDWLLAAAGALSPSELPVSGSRSVVGAMRRRSRIASRRLDPPP